MDHEERIAPIGPYYVLNTIIDSNTRSSGVICIYICMYIAEYFCWASQNTNSEIYYPTCIENIEFLETLF